MQRSVLHIPPAAATARGSHPDVVQIESVLRFMTTEGVSSDTSRKANFEDGECMRKLIATCVMGIGLISFEHGAPLAAPKPTNPGAQVVFADRAGDAIRSDGRGAYVNDVGGATSQIYVNGSGDLTLNLFQTRPKRVFVGTFEAAGDVSQPSAVT